MAASIFFSQSNPLDVVVNNYITRLSTLRIGNSGLPFLNSTTINALDKFVKGCRKDNIWNHLIEINPVIRIPGGTNNILMATTLLKVGPQGAPVGPNIAWTPSAFVEANLTADGLVGVPSSSTFMRTNMVAANTFQSATNAGLTIYASGVTTTNDGVELGAYDPGTVHGTHIVIRANGPGVTQIQSGCWATGGANTLSLSPAVTGGYSFSRVASTDIRAYFGSTKVAFFQHGSGSVADTAIPNTYPLLMWALGVNNVPQSYTDNRISFIVIHDGLTATQTKNLIARIQQYRVDVGGGFA